MNWGEMLSRYGYVAVLVGTFLEGESILVAGALAAHSGFLSLPGVLAAGLAGSFLGDQMFFVLGRRLGRSWLLRHPRWQERAQRVYVLLEDYDAAFILGFRFLYGLRSVSPFVVGASSLRAPRFFVLNFCGALLWTLIVGGLGYCAGDAWASLPEGSVTWPRVGGLAAGMGIVATAWRLLRGGRRRPVSPSQEPPRAP